jgi:hypothetical protein
MVAGFLHRRRQRLGAGAYRPDSNDWSCALALDLRVSPESLL